MIIKPAKGKCRRSEVEYREFGGSYEDFDFLHSVSEQSSLFLSLSQILAKQEPYLFSSHSVYFAKTQKRQWLFCRAHVEQ